MRKSRRPCRRIHSPLIISHDHLSHPGPREKNIRSLNPGSFTSRITTLVPFPAKSSITCLPIPLHPPVTTTSSRAPFHALARVQLFSVHLLIYPFAARSTLSARSTARAFCVRGARRTFCAGEGRRVRVSLARDWTVERVLSRDIFSFLFFLSFLRVVDRIDCRMNDDQQGDSERRERSIESSTNTPSYHLLDVCIRPQRNGPRPMQGLDRGVSHVVRKQAGIKHVCS